MGDTESAFRTGWPNHDGQKDRARGKRSSITRIKIGKGEENGLLSETPGSDGERSYAYDPANPEARFGRPGLGYRTQPLAADLEITGPLSLTLLAQSSATDTDWIVLFADEGPDGKSTTLTKGWLRASHRFFWYSATQATKARNTVLEGKKESRLLIPVIPC